VSIVVVGGNLSAKFYTYIRQLGVSTFRHIPLFSTPDISPEMLLHEASRLRWEVQFNVKVVAVGARAHRLLTLARVEHGTISSMQDHDAKKMEECKKYLSGARI
jgi:hypothetical protein